MRGATYSVISIQCDRLFNVYSTPRSLALMSEIKILKRSHTEGVQTQRKFFKKTAKGRVVKGEILCKSSKQLILAYSIVLVLRERYLRDDVACGIQGICTSDHPPLPPRGDLTHNDFPNGHFILPDTNVFLHQVSNS